MPRRPTIIFRRSADGSDMPEPSGEEVEAALETLRRSMGTVLVVSGFSSLGEYPQDALWDAGEAAWGYVFQRSFYGRWSEADWDNFRAWYYGRWSEEDWAKWRGESQVTRGDDMNDVDAAGGSSGDGIRGNEDGGDAGDAGEESDVTRDSMSMTTICPP